MSGAPNIKRANQFPNPLIIIGITIKKYITRIILYAYTYNKLFHIGSIRTFFSVLDAVSAAVSFKIYSVVVTASIPRIVSVLS